MDSPSLELDIAMMVPFLAGLGTFLAAPHLPAGTNFRINVVSFISSKLTCPPLTFGCVTTYISFRVSVLFMGSCKKQSTSLTPASLLLSTLTSLHFLLLRARAITLGSGSVWIGVGKLRPVHLCVDAYMNNNIGRAACTCRESSMHMCCYHIKFLSAPLYYSWQAVSRVCESLSCNIHSA